MKRSDEGMSGQGMSGEQHGTAPPISPSFHRAITQRANRHERTATSEPPQAGSHDGTDEMRRASPCRPMTITTRPRPTTEDINRCRTGRTGTSEQQDRTARTREPGTRTDTRRPRVRQKRDDGREQDEPTRRRTRRNNETRTRRHENARQNRPDKQNENERTAERNGAHTRRQAETSRRAKR